jgi:carbon monoxide dehydrogenase subunit G
MRMKDFSITVQIAASPERVWQVMSDIERWPEWTPTVASITRTNAGPLRIGARARIRQRWVRPTDWVVTALHEGRQFDWETRRAGLCVVARHLVEPNACGGARATLSVQFKGVLGGIIGRLTGRMNRRLLALEADGLKRRSEAAGGVA